MPDTFRAALWKGVIKINNLDNKHKKQLMSANIASAPNGKLGVMVVGLGAVSTTFMTGVLMARKGLAKPVGSMTQYDRIRVGKARTKNIFTTRT